MKMRILVICQYYYPEPFRISDICESLVKRGHEVTVFTGIPNYPEGVIYDAYKHGERREEVIRGVHVHRCFTIGRKKGSLYRLLNYCSYAFSSTVSVIMESVRFHKTTEYDVVFVNQLSPVMMAYAGIVYKNIHHKKLVMYCLDLWPESLIAGGIKRNSGVYRMFHKISSRIYNACDHVLVTSQLFTEYLYLEFNVDRKKISYLPQYAEPLFVNISKNEEKKSGVDLVLAGNIGEIQGIETVIEAAELLQHEKKLRFHIVGGGTALSRLQQLVINKKLSNVFFYGRKPIENMPDYYSMADAMLVTLTSDPVLNLTLPGKVQSYMAAGKAIIGAINGETAEVIQRAQCGYVASAGDGSKLADTIRRFLRLTDEQKNILEKNARAYYEAYFSKEKFLNQMEQCLLKNI